VAAAGVPGDLDGPPPAPPVRLAWRKGLTGGLRVVQVVCVSTGCLGLLALAVTPLDSWFRNGVGAVVGVLIGFTFVWFTWFGLGWAYLVVRGGQVRLGFGPVPWARPGFPLHALAAVSVAEVDLLSRGGRLVSGDPDSPDGLLVSTGGREAVRMELWDGAVYLVTLRHPEQVVNRLQEVLDEGT
jgi:hypothetical protein